MRLVLLAALLLGCGGESEADRQEQPLECPLPMGQGQVPQWAHVPPVECAFLSYDEDCSTELPRCEAVCVALLHMCEASPCLERHRLLTCD